MRQLAADVPVLNVRNAENEIAMRTVKVGEERLPKYCECGGVILYAVDFGMVFSCCKKCSPVIVLTVDPKTGAVK